jgi:hypothetical protein
MSDYINLSAKPLQTPDQTPLSLEVKDAEFRGLPTANRNIPTFFNSPSRWIDTRDIWDRDAYARRQEAFDTWRNINDLEANVGATQGSYESLFNLANVWGITDKKLFNDPIKGAAIKALFLARSPVQRILYGDSQLTEEGIQTARERLTLLMNNEPAGAIVDPLALTQNQLRIKETIDYLTFASVRKAQSAPKTYGILDVQEASNRDTQAIAGGVWKWYTATAADAWRTPEEERNGLMPKDTADIEQMLVRKDTNFNAQAWFEEKTKDPIIREAMFDNGISLEMVISARNADEAEFYIKRAMTVSNIQSRIANYTANANWLTKSTLRTIVPFAEGMVLTPDFVPFMLTTGAVGGLVKVGGALLGQTLGKATAYQLVKTGTMSAINARRVVGATGKVFGALTTLPIGAHPAYLANSSIFVRLGASAASLGSISALHDIAVQESEMAYAAALEYADPEAQIEFDNYRVFESFGHGAITGSVLFAGSSILSSLTGALSSGLFGVKQTIRLPGVQPITVRGERSFTFKNTPFGELADAFGSIKTRAGTLLNKQPAEVVINEALMKDTKPTIDDLATETQTQVNRAGARAADTADAAASKPVSSQMARLDNETRAQYASRMGLNRTISNSLEFLSELGRRTNADVAANDTIGNDGSTIFNMSPTSRARILIDAEARITEAKAAETAGHSGKALPKDRETFYTKLERDRKRWLTNSIKQLTKVERKEFYTSLRGQPVADRVAIARDTAVSAATRNAAADSVAAQLLEAARTKQKPDNLPPEVSAAVDAATLENAVTGRISEETAGVVKASIAGIQTNKIAKITKIVQRVVKRTMSAEKKAKIQQLAQNHYNFLKIVSDKAPTIMAEVNSIRFFDFINDMVDVHGIMSKEDRTILLAVALEFDFDSKAFDVKYVFDADPNSIAIGAFDYVTDPANIKLVIFTESIKKANAATVNTPSSLTAKTFLHEIGHAIIHESFGPTKYIEMLELYNQEISKAPIFGTTDLMRTYQIPYFFKNAEELFVETYSQFVFARGQAELVASFTPSQKHFMFNIIEDILDRVIDVVYVLDESHYFRAAQPLIMEMQRTQTLLQPELSVSKVFFDLYNARDDVFNSTVGSIAYWNNLPIKDVITGAKSRVSFTKAEFQFIEDIIVDTPHALGAYTLLKAHGKTLVVDEPMGPRFTKSLYDFVFFLKLLEETEFHQRIFKALVADKTNVGSTYISTLDTEDTSRQTFLPYNSIHNTVAMMMMQYTGKGHKDSPVLFNESEWQPLLRQLQSDFTTSNSVVFRVKGTLKHGLVTPNGLVDIISLAAVDADILVAHLAAQIANKPKVRPSEIKPKNETEVSVDRGVIPFTTEGFAAALDTVTKKDAATAITGIMDIIDPFTLAAISRSNDPFEAVKLLSTLVKNNKLYYDKNIQKWSLVKEKVAEPKAPVTAGKKTRTLKDYASDVPEASDSVILTMDNILKHLGDLTNPAHPQGKLVLRMVLGDTKNLANALDAIQSKLLSFTEKTKDGDLYFESLIASGGLTNVTDLRKLLVTSAKNALKDIQGKGQNLKVPGITKLEKLKKTAEAKLQKAIESGDKETAKDLQDELLAINFELETTKPRNTESTGKTTVSGETFELEVVSMPIVTTAGEKEVAPAKTQDMVRGTFLYQVDSFMRFLDPNAKTLTKLFDEDQRKLWDYLVRGTTTLAGGARKAIPTDAELATKSEVIFGRPLEISRVQEIRSASLAKLGEVQAMLKLTPRDILEGFEGMKDGNLNPTGPLANKIRALTEVPKLTKIEPQPVVTPVAPEMIKQMVATQVTDAMALRSKAKKKEVPIPEAVPPANTTVVYTLTNADGKQIGPEVMTAEAADKLIANHTDPLVKEALAVPDKDVVTTTTEGEVLVKPKTEATSLGSARIEDSDGTLVMKDGVTTIAKVDPPKITEATPVVNVVKKPAPKPVKTPLVETEEHINFERVVNEDAALARANGIDVKFLSHFQKAYWTVMKGFDTGGAKTSATPLFQKLFSIYVSINDSIQKSNLTKFGQDKVNEFWKTVDTLRAAELKRIATDPGYKRLSDSALLETAAKKIHREYLAPVLLGVDVEIRSVDGEYKIVGKKRKMVKVVEPSPFPEPVAEEKPTPTAKPVDEVSPPKPTEPVDPTKPTEPVDPTKPVAPAIPEVPAKTEEVVSKEKATLASLLSVAKRMAMPLRMSSFIGHIFGGSNRAERNWWQASTSSLVNILQGASRLGDTFRSDFPIIRVFASLMDGTRNVTGLLVAPGEIPIQTLLSAKGMESRILLRLASAQLDVLKNFGGTTKVMERFQNYMWEKIAKGEEITVAGLVKDMGMEEAAAKDILPSILNLVDIDFRTKDLFLRLSRETELGVAYDVNGNPYDPKTWMNVQLDHEKLNRMSAADTTAVLEALATSRRQRKMGDRLDLNTLIVLGWLDANAVGGGDTGGLLLRNRTFSNGPGSRSLSAETLKILKIDGSLGGPTTSTIASLARHGDPYNTFVIESNSVVTPYRVPKARADLSPADLLIYDTAVSGDTSMYTPRWQKALNNQELVRVEMLELLEHKMKRGRYIETKGQDRPLLKMDQREDVQLAIAGLTPEEILADTTGILKSIIRTNLAEAQHFFLSGRLTELLFQKELDRMFGRTGTTIEDALNVGLEYESKSLDARAKKEGWSERRTKAAQESLKRGITRLREEYRSNVNTLPYSEKTSAGTVAEGGLTLARIATSPGFWLSAGPEVVNVLTHTNVVDYPKTAAEAFKHIFGKYRSSKSAFLNSPIGDISFSLQSLMPEMSNRYIEQLNKGAYEIDSTVDVFNTNLKPKYDNKAGQLAEKVERGAQSFGSLAQITNFVRQLAKHEMQRDIFTNLKKGRIQKLIKAMEDPANRQLFTNYLEASLKSARAERTLWKKFAGLAREIGFGKDPHEALMYLKYGLNTTEVLTHLEWAIDKVGDKEGRVNFHELQRLAEDVRRRPVDGINVDTLDSAVKSYMHAIEAEIARKRAPEPYGLNKMTDMESRSSLGRVIYALTGWLRAFHDGRIVDYSNKSSLGYLKFLAAYAAIDGFVNMIKEWLMGRDVSDIAKEMVDNPASILTRVAHSIPLFGIANSVFEMALNKVSGGSLFSPTMELSTPGLGVISSMFSRTDKGLSKAYSAIKEGDIPTALGGLTNASIIGPALINKSPLAVPVRILEESLALDEKAGLERYLNVVQRPATPYANKMNQSVSSDASRMFSGSIPTATRNLAQEGEAYRKANAFMGQPKGSPSIPFAEGNAAGTSAPLADLLKRINKP